MSSYLLLDTRDKTNGNNYNCSWNVINTLLNVHRNYSVSLSNVEFPHCVYPINRFNEQIRVTDSAGSVTVILDDNNYTGAQMASHLTTKLSGSALNGTYTVTYDTQSKKLSFQCTENMNFETVDNHCYDELGLDQTGSLFTTPFTAATTADWPVNLSGTQYVDLITNFHNNNYTVSTTARVLARIPVVEAFGNIVYYEWNTRDNLFTGGDSISVVEMSLRDSKGNAYELPDNAYFSLTLRLTHHDEASQSSAGSSYESVNQDVKNNKSAYPGYNNNRP